MSVNAFFLVCETPMSHDINNRFKNIFRGMSTAMTLPVDDIPK